MARTPKDIKWKEVERRIELGQSGIQISKALWIDSDTFYKRFKEEYGCSIQDYSAKYTQVKEANILFTQYIKALNGNTKMLELLGKEWLGQGKLEELYKINEAQAIKALENQEYAQE